MHDFPSLIPLLWMPISVVHTSTWTFWEIQNSEFAVNSRWESPQNITYSACRTKDLPFVIYQNLILFHFKICSGQHHDDRANCGGVSHCLASNLYVEVLKWFSAMGGKYVIADSRKIIHVTVKCLEVKGTPCAADLSIMSGVNACENPRGCKELIHTPLLHFVWGG